MAPQTSAHSLCTIFNVDSVPVSIETSRDLILDRLKRLSSKNIPSRQNEVTFATMQFETSPSTGRVHLQAYFQVKSPAKNDQWELIYQAVFGPNYGSKICGSMIRGSSEDNIAYCSKPKPGELWVPGNRIQGTLPIVFRTPRSIEGKAQGERSDLSQVYEWIKDHLDDNNIWGKCMEEFTGTASFILLSTRRQWFNDIVQNLQQQKLRKELEEDMSALDLLPWQTQMVNILSVTPDTRLIHVVVDAVGGAGKSTLLNYLSVKSRWISLSCGKRDDLLHALRQQLTNNSMMGIAVDCPMSSVINGVDSRTGVYQFVESIKNRVVTAMKYDSKVLYIPKCHILIMTNQDIPEGAFGDARLRIHTLKKVAGVITMSSKTL